MKEGGQVVLEGVEEDLSYSIIRQRDIVVATPSSSWTLLESMVEKTCEFGEEESKFTFLEDEDDDGLADEEKRLERVSERLEELEREVPELILAAENEDVKYADAVILSESNNLKQKSQKHFIYCVAAYLFLLFISAALGLSRPLSLSTENVAVKAPLSSLKNNDIMNETQISSSLFKEEEPSLNYTNKTQFLSDLEVTLSRSAEHLTQKNALRLLTSAGLGVLGLAVGIPYVPGITDNLLVGITAAALPLFSSNSREEDDEIHHSQINDILQQTSTQAQN